jgi:hypothetical protein
MFVEAIVKTPLPIVAILTSLTGPACATEPTGLIRAAIRLPCDAVAGSGLKALADQLPSARSIGNWVLSSPSGPAGARMVFEVGDGELTVEFSGSTGSPDDVSARYLAGAARRPLLLAIADYSCTVHTARQVAYDSAGRPELLQNLDNALDPIGEPQPLNPPVPAGDDPPGIPIGLVDSGVNYLLPEIALRLARASDGEILGYDYWDLDRRPFDVAPLPDPFFPDHHGTSTASLVLDGAPAAKLIPYRYPRHDMARMAALIEDAASRGIRVMNLSLASPGRDEWLPFQEAARTHPDMLFVVAAGNYDRSLERTPFYPAAFRLPNMVVVTSATADGHLTEGVNWGAKSVDVMVHGEDVLALNFDGKWRPVSGSSYATARVSALAACLLAEHPEWTTGQLRSAIFRLAQPSETGDVAEGFIPDEVLGSRGACAPQQVVIRSPSASQIRRM